MFLKIFKSDRPLTLVVFTILIFLLWLPELFSDKIILYPFDNQNAPLNFFNRDFYSNNPFLPKIIAFVFNLIVAFILIRLNTRFFFISTRTNMPALVYLLLISSIPSLQRITPVHFSVVIIILAISRLMSSYKHKGIAYHYFDASMMIAVSSMIYVPSVYFMVFIWAGLAILRPFNWREWAFTIIGFILPFLFLFTYYYWTDEGFLSGVNNLLIAFREESVKMIFNLENKIFFAYTFVLIVFASFFILKSYESRKIQTRKYFLFFLLIFIISVVLYLFLPSIGIEILFIMAIPVTYLLSHYFVFIRSGFINNMLFTLLILTILWICYNKIIMSLFV